MNAVRTSAQYAEHNSLRSATVVTPKDILELESMSAIFDYYCNILENGGTVRIQLHGEFHWGNIQHHCLYTFIQEMLKKYPHTMHIDWGDNRSPDDDGNAGPDEPSITPGDPNPLVSLGDRTVKEVNLHGRNSSTGDAGEEQFVLAD